MIIANKLEERTKEYLKAIKKYPIEIIALLLLISAVAFGYKFYTSDMQIRYLLYSLLFFFLAILPLLYIHRLKNKTIKDQVSFYPTMHEIKNAINSLFQKISENSEVTQTYIRNNFLAGSQDILFKDIFINIKEKDTRPKINRIFILFDPLDINFAEHSFELCDGQAIYSKGDYGCNLNNIYISGSKRDRIVNVIPNITAIDGKVLVTFPSRTNQYNKFPKKLIENPEGNATKGIKIESKEFYDEYKSFLTSAQTERLNDIKAQFYSQDKIAYFYSILFSISKEILHDEILKNKILFIGIVGSLANHVENTGNQSDDENINDLDLQIILKEFSSDKFKISKNICEYVSRRFSIDGVVNFYVETKSTPVKSCKISSGVPQIPIHLLLSDKKSCKKWDKFIAIDRIHHGGNVTFEWILEENKKINKHDDLKNLVKESAKDGIIKYKDLIDKNYFYSLSNCIKVLYGNTQNLKIKDWQLDIDGEYEFKEVEQELTPIEIANFAKYSLKWGVINFFNSGENYNINKNSYTRNFIYAVNQIKSVVTDIDSELLVNIYNKNDSEISQNEINIIVENIKFIENYVGLNAT